MGTICGYTRIGHVINNYMYILAKNFIELIEIFYWGSFKKSRIHKKLKNILKKKNNLNTIYFLYM